MYAIVKTGGKQYRVAVGDVIAVEKLAACPEELVELEVVFIADGANVTTDAGALLRAKVFAVVVEEFKGEKQIIFKFKKRKGYKKLRGHRQSLTRLKIEAISLDGKVPKITKKAVETKPEVKKDKEALPAEGVEDKPAKKAAAKRAAKPKAGAVENAVDTAQEETTETPVAESVEVSEAEAKEAALPETEEVVEEAAPDESAQEASEKSEE